MESGAAPEHPASIPGGLPEWFDPDRDAMLTPSRLRGLVHPIRVRLLNRLQADGPATASQLGRRIGQSSGVTSYHLRILADLGFIVEDTERGTGRDRWWRPRFRGSSLTFRSPDDPGDAETIELAGQYIRLDVEQAFERAIAYVDSLAARRDELPHLPWTFSEWDVEVTREEARALATEVNNLMQRYRYATGGTPRPGTERAVFQFQFLPTDRPERTEPTDEEQP